MTRKREEFDYLGMSNMLLNADAQMQNAELRTAQQKQGVMSGLMDIVKGELPPNQKREAILTYVKANPEEFAQFADRTAATFQEQGQENVQPQQGVGGWFGKKMTAPPRPELTFDTFSQSLTKPDPYDIAKKQSELAGYPDVPLPAKQAFATDAYKSHGGNEAWYGLPKEERRQDIQQTETTRDGKVIQQPMGFSPSSGYSLFGPQVEKPTTPKYHIFDVNNKKVVWDENTPNVPPVELAGTEDHWAALKEKEANLNAQVNAYDKLVDKNTPAAKAALQALEALQAERDGVVQQMSPKAASTQPQPSQQPSAFEGMPSSANEQIQSPQQPDAFQDILIDNAPVNAGPIAQQPIAPQEPRKFSELVGKGKPKEGNWEVYVNDSGATAKVNTKDPEDIQKALDSGYKPGSLVGKPQSIKEVATSELVGELDLLQKSLFEAETKKGSPAEIPGQIETIKRRSQDINDELILRRIKLSDKQKDKFWELPDEERRAFVTMLDQLTRLGDKGGWKKKLLDKLEE